MHGGCCFFLPRYYGTRGEEFSHCLLMEYLNGEPLDRFSKSRKETLSLRSKLFLLFHLVHGVRFLIGREIVHLDLKPANVVVCKQLIPKIVDFGSAYHRELCPKGNVKFT
jgi:serine/threonine protein kinase